MLLIWNVSLKKNITRLWKSAVLIVKVISIFFEEKKSHGPDFNFSTLTNSKQECEKRFEQKTIR